MTAPEDIARAVSTHDFDLAFPHLADDVVWRAMGGADVVGRDAVIRQCTDLTAELDGVSVELHSVRVLSCGSTVVVETRADYTSAGEEPSAVASCDVYDFADDVLTSISSYNVEVPVGSVPG